MSDSETKLHSNNNQKKLLIGYAIVLLAWMTMTILLIVFKEQTGRFFVDTYDISAYFDRGKWLIENTPAISEYPQIPTLLFGINHLFSILFGTNFQFMVFVSIFSLEMLIVLFLVFKVLLELLPSHLINYAYLVFLPPTLYFTYNRFDILPAYLCLIAFSGATKRNWSIVSIILAIATFTKWYPVLLFPGFLMYASKIETKFQWKMILIFTTASIAILLLSYLQGGLETILAPYQFHAVRSMEYVAFPVLFENFIQNLLNINIYLPNYFLILFIIQLSGPILILFIKIDSLELLIDYCIITIGLFVFFSRIWSPQFFLWLLPFLVISAKNKNAVGLIIAYIFITYLSFPIIFDYFGSYSFQLQISGLMTYIIIFSIILRSIRNIILSKNLLTRDKILAAPIQ